MDQESKRELEEENYRLKSVIKTKDELIKQLMIERTKLLKRIESKDQIIQQFIVSKSAHLYDS